jgi:hypothetical protein
VAQSRRHNQSRVDGYVRMLRSMGAPEELVEQFIQIVDIDNGLSDALGKSQDSLDDLLLDCCKRVGFAKPFETDGKQRWIRPSLCADEPSAFDSDTPQSVENFDPKKEQAYRRGYDQGFAEAVYILQSKRNLESLKERHKKISQWRRSPLYTGSTPPGTSEGYLTKVSYRTSLPPKLRFDVLERDGFRCKICGSSADDGSILHVDHIVSIKNNGSNDIENLQTLCDVCNFGKGGR